MDEAQDTGPEDTFSAQLGSIAMIHAIQLGLGVLRITEPNGHSLFQNHRKQFIHNPVLHETAFDERSYLGQLAR